MRHQDVGIKLIRGINLGVEEEIGIIYWGEIIAY